MSQRLSPRKKVAIGALFGAMIFAVGSLTAFLLVPGSEGHHGGRDGISFDGALEATADGSPSAQAGPGGPEGSGGRAAAADSLSATGSEAVGQDHLGPAGPSDADAVTVAPEIGEVGEAQDPIAELDESFGGRLVPESAAGYTLSGPASVSPDIISAVYVGGPDTNSDLLRLIVKRTSSPEVARAALDEMNGDFPVGPVAFTYGGRAITQFITDEGRPDQYPPAMTFSWLQGSYAIQVAVIPIRHDRVEASRSSALEFIGTLPY